MPIRVRGLNARGTPPWLWYLVPVATALTVLIPLGVLLLSWHEPQAEVWRHLLDTQLRRLLGNTLWLLFGVGCCTAVLGVGLAWLTAVCEFPGRRWLDWALMLPLALPGYVLAFVVLGQWDYLGPVQTTLRRLLGADFAMEVRNPLTVVLVLSGVLYPYVYMLSRSAFLSQGCQTLEAARSLGLTPSQAFLRLSLPLARPAIAVGLSLALMEALADFGAVAVFNYDTFTTAIYKAWFGLFNLQAAAQLSTLLLLFVALAVLGERLGRGRRRYDQAGRRAHQYRLVLAGWRRWAASLVCAAVFVLTFVVPVSQLLVWTAQTGAQALTQRYWNLLAHTLYLGLVGAALVVLVGLLLAVSVRQRDRWSLRLAALIANLGYALPGSVLAVGVALGLGSIERLVRAVGVGEVVLTGTLAALLLAYLVRFMAVAHGPLEVALQQVKPGLAEVAKLLGAKPGRLLLSVYLPMIRPGLVTATLLVLVEVMKEMPATLLMRPFGWDTLAVKIFELTSEGEWRRAALPALTIVLIGLFPVALAVRRERATA